MFAKGSGIDKRQLQKIGEIHSRNKVDIAPNLYSFWADSLITAIYKHDASMTEEMEKQWRAILQESIYYLITFY
jgi:hypothetical protein